MRGAKIAFSPISWLVCCFNYSFWSGSRPAVMGGIYLVGFVGGYLISCLIGLVASASVIVFIGIVLLVLLF